MILYLGGCSLLVVCMQRFSRLHPTYQSNKRNQFVKDFLRTFSGLSKDFLRTFSGLSLNILRTFSLLFILLIPFNFLSNCLCSDAQIFMSLVQQFFLCRSVRTITFLRIFNSGNPHFTNFKIWFIQMCEYGICKTTLYF